MSHMDSKTLVTYNSLIDPHLRSYFSSERMQSHLKHAGLINRRGNILSDSEYRSRLVRREQKKHVRQILAEDIVHRAIDMERARQAAMSRQLDTIAKAALVNNVKGSKRHDSGHLSPNNIKSDHMGLLSVHASWSQTRSKSTKQHRDIELMNEEFDGQSRILRVQSANINEEHHRKSFSKNPTPHRHYLNRPKSTSIPRSSSLSSKHPRSKRKPLDSSLINPLCQITMVYYGPHTKVVYDHSIFDAVDEIMVMQQHCGGENLVVYKANHKVGDDFTFNSRRHYDYPFGLSLYVNGLIDSRISTCCEYKHRHGVRLGGERGHFAIVSVDGSKPCLKCRFEKQTRLKQIANSSKDSNEIEEGRKPIIISKSVSDEPRTKQTPVKISIKPRSESTENYSEDFDELDKEEKTKDKHSSNSNGNKNKTQGSTAEVRPKATRAKSTTESDSTLTPTSQEKSSRKTWQIIFHSSNIPTGSIQLPKKSTNDAFLIFSFISTNGKDETEQYKIDIREFPQCFQSDQQGSFQVKLKNIGKPKQIRLILDIQDETNMDIKWHLDYIEVIDPKTQSSYKFSCNQWIRPSQEKLLNLTEPSQDKTIRKSSSEPISTATKQKPRISSCSSSDEYPKQISTISQKQQISIDDEQNKTRYRVIVHPSKEHDGEFNASNDSRIFIRLNNQTKESEIHKKDTKSCPSFQSGQSQTFEIDLPQHINEQPTKLTIGYYNSNDTAEKWKLQKIVLINTETGEETVFPCNELLLRNSVNSRAEKIFHAQSKQSDTDDDRQSTPRNVNVSRRIFSPSDSDESIQQKQIPSNINIENWSSSSSESLQQTIAENKNDIKSSSRRSSQNLNNDDKNTYKRLFKKKNESESPPSRPKTRRGRQDTIEKESEHENTINKPQSNSDIWRPSSELDRKERVDPLVGLNDQKDSNHTDNPWKNWYPDNN